MNRIPQIVRLRAGAMDRDGAPVFLAKSNWELGYAAEKFPAIRFAKTRERADVHAES
jgi:peptide chain release factor 3